MCVLCICVSGFIYTEREPRFVYVRGGLVFKNGYSVMSARLYLSEALCPSCRSWHCVSGDLTRTFLPSLPRRSVFTLFVFDVFVFAHTIRLNSYNKTTQ